VEEAAAAAAALCRRGTFFPARAHSFNVQNNAFIYRLA
jgi:hypothetical protein